MNTARGCRGRPRRCGCLGTRFFLFFHFSLVVYDIYIIDYVPASSIGFWGCYSNTLQGSVKSMNPPPTDGK